MTPKRHQSTRVHANMFGYRGVEWEQSRGKFRARIEPANGSRGRWLGRFDTAEDAARAYDDAAREVYGEAAFLNFPRDGESAVVRSVLKDGICANGHGLDQHGYKRPDGRGIICRECNRLAANRYYKRRIALPQS